jgi:8-oxo-dGTP diphosphatase
MPDAERAAFPVGVNVIVLRDGKLLLGKRKSPGYHDGEWGLPGGHLERGEKVIDCGARELLEETGLTAKKLMFALTDNDIREDNVQYIHFCLLAEEVSGELALCEPDKCYEWGWFPLDDLPEPLFIGHRKLVRGFIVGKTFVEE